MLRAAGAGDGNPGGAGTLARIMKRIGFLSFGHWRAAPGSQTRTAAEALLQTIELAQAAESIGIDGGFVRVHHFEHQLASPFPLLAAIAARTSRIEIGTAVIDMRRKTGIFLAALGGAAVARTDPARTGVSGGLAIQPQSPGLAGRIWWGSGTRATAQWAAGQGMNLQSSTLHFGEQAHEDQIGLLEGVRSSRHDRPGYRAGHRLGTGGRRDRGVTVTPLRPDRALATLAHGACRPDVDCAVVVPTGSRSVWKGHHEH